MALVAQATHHAAVDAYGASVPEKYEMIGAYLWRIKPLRIACDFGLSFRMPGSPAELYLPDLWITWTDRAPRPIGMETRRVELDQRTGLPVTKLSLTDGTAAVFQEWQNAPGLHPAVRINSSLNWFEGGRLWAIQAPEPLEVLLEIAQSLKRQ